MGKYTPMLFLTGLILACIAGLVAVTFSPAPPSETQFIQNSLYGLAGVLIGIMGGALKSDLISGGQDEVPQVVVNQPAPQPEPQKLEREKSSVPPQPWVPQQTSTEDLSVYGYPYFEQATQEKVNQLEQLRHDQAKDELVKDRLVRDEEARFEMSETDYENIRRPKHHSER